ncbi:recombinase family protein [Pediococcus acidilactici]|nr:recombinase family protein [Pediococcus acidilactici]MBM6644388.1 recombinase family protein [Pediococcus acidilactici]
MVHLIKPNDTLIVIKLDRFARSTREALNLIDDLLKEKIMIKVLNLGTIDNTPIERMIVRTLLSVAEVERDMIIERMQAGKIFARQHNPNYKEGIPKRKEDSWNMAIFEYSNSHTVKEAAEAIKLLKGISLLKSQQSTSALNHIRVSQILYKYFLRRNQNQQIRLSITEIISTAKTP